MTDKPESVILQITETIATITLNIPKKHNALDGDNIQQFCDHLDTIQNSKDIRVLIVTGSGEKTFCAGAALNELGSGAIDGDRFTEMTEKLATLPQATIAEFNGSAYGGGSEIGLACDFRIGIHGMRVFVPPARIGLCYPLRGIERFVQVLGVATAKRLLVASEEFNAEQLLDIGYLTDLTDRGELNNKVKALAERIAGYAPLAVKAMKQLCNDVASGQLDRQRAQEMIQHCNNSDDLQEGLRAQKEKRVAEFNGQ
jgi:enoyl-CoA hydratase/carnithine racemase